MEISLNIISYLNRASNQEIKLINSRIPANIGSDLDLTCPTFAHKLGVQTTSLVAPLYLTGFGGSSGGMIEKIDIEIVINNFYVKLSPFLTKSDLFERTGTVLILGRCSIGKGKKFSLVIPSDSDPVLSANKHELIAIESGYAITPHVNQDGRMVRGGALELNEVLESRMDLDQQSNVEPHHLKLLEVRGGGAFRSNPRLNIKLPAEDGGRYPLGNRLLHLPKPLTEPMSTGMIDSVVNVHKPLRGILKVNWGDLRNQAAESTRAALVDSLDSSPTIFDAPQEVGILGSTDVESSSLRHCVGSPGKTILKHSPEESIHTQNKSNLELVSKLEIQKQPMIARLHTNTLNHDVRVNPRKGHRRRKSEKVNQNKLAQKESKEILATAYRYDLPKRSVDSPDFMSAAIQMQQQVVDLDDFSSKWHLIGEEASIVASMLAEEGIPYTSSSLIVSGLTIDIDPVSEEVTTQVHAELDDGPDKERNHIFWELSIEQQELVKEFREASKDTIVPSGTEIPYGECLFDDFSLVLTKDAEATLRREKMKPFPVTGSNYDLLKKSTEDMANLNKGYLGSAAYASPCFFAKRRRSDKLRLCTAHNKLNSVTVEERFVLPTVDEIIKLFKGKKYFSLIDLKSAYNQCRLSEFAQQYCGMILPWGIFVNKVLNFGLKNAPAYFQKWMTKCLEKGIKDGYVMVFIDDIIIFSDTFEDHLQHLYNVTEMLRVFNLKASDDKVFLLLSQVKVLGLICNGNGYTTDQSRIEDMLNFPKPKNETQVRRFIGLVGSYRDFVKDFNLIAQPLIKITSKGKYKWEDDQQKAFEQLKQAVCSSPCLVYPDPNRKMRLQLDGSLTGAGAVLLQLMDDEKWHPVAFGSWLYNSAQRNYGTTDRETLPLIFSLGKWRSLMLSRRLQVLTDHKPMPGHVNQKDPHGRYARWQSLLHGWGLDFDYIKGVLNVAPDAFSRTGEFDDYADVDQFVTAIILFEMTLLGRGEELSDLMVAAVLSQPEVEDEQMRLLLPWRLSRHYLKILNGVWNKEEM